MRFGLKLRTRFSKAARELLENGLSLAASWPRRHIVILKLAAFHRDRLHEAFLYSQKDAAIFGTPFINNVKKQALTLIVCQKWQEKWPAWCVGFL